MTSNLAEQLAPKQLLHLLMLSSTALPIGAYCYSQGVESAIENGIITNELSATAYFDDVLDLMLLGYELPMLCRLMTSASDPILFDKLAQSYRASRETKELLAESQQMASSLNAWIKQVLQPSTIHSSNQPNTNISTIDSSVGFLPVYAYLCSYLNLPIQECASALAFTILENQVLGVVKTVPLGQMAGQRILLHLMQQLAFGIKNALELGQDMTIKLNSHFPHLAMLSMQHEQQYSRLFRS